jgi:hypothetical protein
MKVQDGGLYALHGERSTIFVLFTKVIQVRAYRRMAWRLMNQLETAATPYAHF